MSVFRTVAVLALAGSMPMLATAARAADLITYPTSTNESVAVAPEPKMDWSGFYVGIYGVAQISPAGGDQFGLGVSLGALAQYDMFVLGGEVAAHGLTTGNNPTTTSYGQVLAKAGVLVADNVLLYGAAGFGIDMGPPNEAHALVGAGVELAATDHFTVDAQYLHGFPVQGANPIDQFTLGAKYHF